MKKGVEIYGIVIVAVILLSMILTYFFDKKDGFMGQISKTPPSSELGSEDQGALIKDIGGREKPVLRATIKTLKKGETYDLIHEFSIEATNTEGQRVSVQIDQVTYEDGSVVDVEQGFTPKKSGLYKVECSAKEVYQSFVLKAENVYKFTVD